MGTNGLNSNRNVDNHNDEQGVDETELHHDDSVRNIFKKLFK